jgi:hypothetical protein
MNSWKCSRSFSAIGRFAKNRSDRKLFPHPLPPCRYIPRIGYSAGEELNSLRKSEEKNPPPFRSSLDSDSCFDGVSSTRIDEAYLFQEG